MTISLDKTSVKTTTYFINNDLYNNFFVEVVEDTETIQAYLSHKGYGLKTHIYGCMKESTPRKQFMDILKDTIEEDIEFFIDEMKDYDNFCAEKINKMFKQERS